MVGNLILWSERNQMCSAAVLPRSCGTNNGTYPSFQSFSVKVALCLGTAVLEGERHPKIIFLYLSISKENSVKL